MTFSRIAALASSSWLPLDSTRKDAGLFAQWMFREASMTKLLHRESADLSQTFRSEKDREIRCSRAQRLRKVCLFEGKEWIERSRWAAPATLPNRRITWL